jgi:hypothetical protein
MKKILTAVIAAISVGAAAIATPSPAKAWWGWGPAVAGGVIAGAIVAARWRRALTTRRPFMGRIRTTDPVVVAYGTAMPGCRRAS